MQPDEEIIRRIRELRPRIAAALAERGKPGMADYALTYLDVMAEILEIGSSDDRYSYDYRGRLMGAIGKTVGDDFAFSESPLEQEFFDVANAFYGENGYQSDAANRR